MNIRNNISYSCKKAVPKPCPLRSFPGRQVHYAFSQCLSVNSSINVQYIVSQESLLKSWLHISSLNLSDADGLLCSLPRWRRDHLLFNMSDHLLFTLSGDGLCDVACVLLLKPDVCLVCYAVVVVRTTSLCLSLQQIDGTYALCVMLWLSSVQPPFVLACSKQIGTLSNILFLWKQMSFLLWKTEKSWKQLTQLLFGIKKPSYGLTLL